MGWTGTITAGGVALVVLLLAAFLHARRRLGTIGLLPWDYVMIICAIIIMAATTHGWQLWQDDWPLPWE